MRKGVKIYRKFPAEHINICQASLKRGKKVKDFQNFSCIKIFARKPKKKKSRSNFSKFSCRTHLQLLGVITRIFFVQNTSLFPGA